MRRSELKKLADTRLKDALSLLSDRRYGACYYLAGYAVECALKACIAKQFRANTIPEPKKVNDIYKHKLDRLIGIAELNEHLKRQRKSDPDFEARWNVVKDWSPERRYQLGVTHREANDLIDAINHPGSGILQWLRRYW